MELCQHKVVLQADELLLSIEYLPSSSAADNGCEDNPSAVKSAEKTAAMFREQEEHFERARKMMVQGKRGKGMGFAS